MRVSECCAHWSINSQLRSHVGNVPSKRHRPRVYQPPTTTKLMNTSAATQAMAAGTMYQSGELIFASRAGVFKIYAMSWGEECEPAHNSDQFHDSDKN